MAPSVVGDVIVETDRVMPPDATVAHAPSPRRYVVEDAVPVAEIPLTGKPLQLVNVPDDGVPSAGVVNVGDVRVLLVNVWVSVVPTTSPVGAVLAANAVRSAS